MSQSRKTVSVFAVLLVALLAGSIWALRGVDRARGKQATLEEVLYLPSGKTVKRMSLGYSSLLADIYWTRAVQYFGERHQQKAERYDLLYPLLDITTDLDPQLAPAYQTGAIFLCQPVPAGAGEPDKAVTLLEKGIAANPANWRTYFTLGFVQYLEKHDYKAAEAAFQRGSEVPGAHPWMRAMAAKMAEHAEDIETATMLWKGIYDTSHDKEIRKTALQHLSSLRAEADLRELRRRVQLFHDKTGTWPASWMDLVRAGLMPGIPQDPSGKVYTLSPEGTVWVQDAEKFPFLTAGAAGH
jgi:tetratricopeptide (TPR) repeat protein